MFSPERAKLFTDNRKQIGSAHAHVIGAQNTVTEGDNMPCFGGQLPQFYWNLTQNEAFLNCFSHACERITDDVST